MAVFMLLLRRMDIGDCGGDTASAAHHEPRFDQWTILYHLRNQRGVDYDYRAGIDWSSLIFVLSGLCYSGRMDCRTFD